MTFLDPPFTSSSDSLDGLFLPRIVKSWNPFSMVDAGSGSFFQCFLSAFGGLAQL